METTEENSKYLFSANALYVMSWVADLDKDKFIIKFINHSFADFIKSDCFNCDYFAVSGNIIKGKKDNEIDLHSLLTQLTAPFEKDKIDRFISSIKLQINELKGQSIHDDFEDDPYIPSDQDFDVATLKKKIKSTEFKHEKILALTRLFYSLGIKFPLQTGKQSSDLLSERYDLLATLQIKCDEEEKITIERVQGILIPVHRRYQLLLSWRKERINALVGNVITRSFSHNIGSHALVGVENQLRKAVNNGESYNDDNISLLADIIEYSNKRAELIASASSGAILSFYLPVSVDDFILPQYIKLYLNDGVMTTINCQDTIYFNNGKSVHGKIKQKKEREIIVDVGEKTISCKTGEIKKIISGVFFIDAIGGVFGKQALCAIIENFVRNSYRHQKRIDTNKGVQIKIEITENERYHSITLYDDNAKMFDYADNSKLINKVNALNENFIYCLEFLEKFKEKSEIDYKLGMMEMLNWSLFLNGKKMGDVITDEGTLRCLKLSFKNNPKKESPLECKDFFHILKYDERGDNNVSLTFNIKKQVPLYSFDNNTLISDPISARIFVYPSNYEGNHYAGRRIIRISDNNYITPFGTIDLITTKNTEDNEELKYQKILIHSILNKNNKFHNKKIWLIVQTNDVTIIEHNTSDFTYDNDINLKVFKDVDTVELNNFISENIEGVFCIWQWHSSEINNFINVHHYETLEGKNTYREIIKQFVTDKDEVKKKVYLGYLLEAALCKVLIIEDRFNSEEIKELNAKLIHSGIEFYNPLNKDNDVKMENKDLSPYSIVSVHVSLGKSKSLFPGDNDFKEFSKKTDDLVPYFSLHTGRAIDSEGKSYEHAFFSFGEINQYANNSVNKLFLVNMFISGNKKKLENALKG